MTRHLALAVLLIAAAVSPARGQALGSWTATVSNQYRIVPDIVYHTANNWDAKLDVYTPVAPGPHPTVLHIHGGGWVGGTRESVELRMLPYLEMGFAVVNISYRLARVSEAPAAVEDCRCALRWVFNNAKEYGFDTSRIVVMGYSAGGHLALTTGMLTPAAGFDRQCGAGPQDAKVAAIVNWYGIADVVDLLEGSNSRTYAVGWLGSRPDRAEVAKRVSPMSYVRKDLPPILTIHGDADPVVPYKHGQGLHAALQKAGATSEFVTISNGKHGNFPPADQIKAIDAVKTFLGKHGFAPRRAPSTAGQQ